MEQLLGAHFSIAKGLHNALYTAADSYGCNAVQIFTKNATTWKERILTRDQINQFDQAKKKTGIKAISSHASYLINPATYENKKYKMSYNALKHELIRCSMLDIPWLVLHPGSHLGKGEEWGIDRIADGINNIFSDIRDNQTRVLLETTAGQGSGIGHSFEQLAAIIDRIKYPENVGICIDTCHIFAAGYDIRTKESYNKTIDKFDSVLGLNRAFLIHLNDSKKKCGSRVDRHEHIGLGNIGIKAFEMIMKDRRLFDIPKIIETPKGDNEKDWDRVNLNILRKAIS